MSETEKQEKKRDDSAKFRKAVVLEVLSGGTQTSISKKYNISKHSILTWMKKYGGKKYNEEQKRTIL
jgi:transposase